MKKVFASLWEYHLDHFDRKLYFSFVLLLTGILVFNYSLDFEDSYIDTIQNFWLRWLVYFLYEAVPFLGAGLLLLAFKKASPFLNERSFWILLFVGFLILTLDRAIHIRSIVLDFVPRQPSRIWFRSLSWASSLLIIMVPLMLLYDWFDRQSSHRWYGLIPGHFDPRPYFYLLLIAGVFIGLGSFFGDIQSYYPRYRIGDGQQFAAYYDVGEWLPLTLFELTYASNFITVELFFRGFLIYAFTRYFGSYAVLPMIVAYCVLHFGKPLTESISSIFGGYALGILALKNRNIWGGVIIHIGVAWLMEIFGFLQRWVQH